MAISNLLKVDPTIPNLISSFAPKKTGLVSTTPTSGTPNLSNYTVPNSLSVTKPVTGVGSTAVSTQTAGNTGGAGSYKGVPLSGTDAQIAEQMRQIDNPTPVVTAPAVGTQTTPPAPTPPAGSTPTTPPVKGLFPDVLSSIRTAGTQSQQLQQEANAKIQKLREDLQNGVSGIQAQPQTLNYGVGRINALSSNEAAKETSVAQKEAADVAAYGTNINALQSIAGYASPRTADVLIDPTTGQPINGGDIGSEMARLASLRAGAATAGQFTGDYQTGLATLRAADTIGQQILGTLQANPTLNSQPLSAITNLKQLISGQISSGPQQLLSQQINQYIQTLGLDSNTVMNIASQQQGTLGQLLDSLRTSAAAQVESKNPQNVINNPQGTNSTAPTGGQVINTSVGPIDNAWFN